MQFQAVIGLIMVFAGIILTAAVLLNASKYQKRESEAKRNLED